MPRPGPRPYECVRRAWHSDRHQPMRGSLIQEIFRIVNESHSSVTRKNKEWQEKLPIVVLKAEEIVYFKANSEVEYMDLKTLWDRVNDAIDTIIKREESSETGELLHPCIEAALHLGCTPRTASRSQRNNPSVCYLGSRDQEALSSSPISLRDKIHGKPNAYGQFLPQDIRSVTPNTIKSSAFNSFETDTTRAQNLTSIGKRFPFLPEKNIPRDVAQRFSNPHYSIYPLYFGSESNLKEPGHGTKNFLGHDQPKDDEGCVWKNSSEQNSLADCRETHMNQPRIECDLSLRLGPTNSLSQEKPNLLSSRKSSSKPQDDPNVEAMSKKQKKVVSHLYDRQFCSPLKLPFNHFVGKMRNSSGP